MLQWGPPRVEGVADVVVQQAAQGRHVDVGERDRRRRSMWGSGLCGTSSQTGH